MSEFKELFKFIKEKNKRKKENNALKELEGKNAKIKENITADFYNLFEEIQGLKKQHLKKLFYGVNEPLTHARKRPFTVEFQGKEIIKFTTDGNGFKLRIKWLPQIFLANISFKGKATTSGLISLMVIRHLKKVFAEEQDKKAKSKKKKARKKEKAPQVYTGRYQQPGQTPEGQDWSRG
jgi:hypothetical protein